MKKVKRPFDDYVVYFREGSLNDREIAEKLGVSKVNVWRMRQKWESGENSVSDDSRLSISEDTLEHLLSQTFRSEVNARKVRSELDLECANLKLGFIRAFKQYSSVELFSMHTKIENLRAEIDALNKASSKKTSNLLMEKLIL